MAKTRARGWVPYGLRVEPRRLLSAVSISPRTISPSGAGAGTETLLALAAEKLSEFRTDAVRVPNASATPSEAANANNEARK